MFTITWQENGETYHTEVTVVKEIFRTCLELFERGVTEVRISDDDGNAIRFREET